MKINPKVREMIMKKLEKGAPNIDKGKVKSTAPGIPASEGNVAPNANAILAAPRPLPMKGKK